MKSKAENARNMTRIKQKRAKMEENVRKSRENHTNMYKKSTISYKISMKIEK